MTSTNDSTTLVCLFHHQDQARAALQDLYEADVPRSSISLIGNQRNESSEELRSSTLDSLGVPQRDLEHLREGVRSGGTIVAVSAISEHVATVERIFGKHQATKIDETVAREAESVAAPVGAAAALEGERAIPIVEEELQVGKRTVDQGGVRVYRRIVEVPAEQTVNLREEHVIVQRNAVDRPATQADLDRQGERSIELTETAEEAVIAKNARVVEEVVLGKQAGEHTEHIRETVRRTEVEVEELPAAGVRTPSKNNL